MEPEVYEDDEVRESFINPKTENEAFVVSFLSNSLFFLIFFVESTTCEVLRQVNTYDKAVVVPRFLSGISKSGLLQSWFGSGKI